MIGRENTLNNLYKNKCLKNYEQIDNKITNRDTIVFLKCRIKGKKYINIIVAIIIMIQMPQRYSKESTNNTIKKIKNNLENKKTNVLLKKKDTFNRNMIFNKKFMK